jgi:hypothetical protein
VLTLLRGTVAPQLAAIYPKFAEKLFGIPIEHAASSARA